MEPLYHMSVQIWKKIFENNVSKKSKKIKKCEPFFKTSDSYKVNT